jgi:hypothetical protein
MDNGLLAATYVPLTDIDTDVGRQLLVALGRARIAAYLASTDVDAPQGRTRLYVNADERSDARTIVAAAIRALGEAEQQPQQAHEDPLAGVDTDQAFAALVADWHVDTVAAIREAERALSREDEDWRARLEQPPAEDPVWLDDEHYVPPPPPPLPRLSGRTILAIALMAVSIAVLALGGYLGLGTDLTLLLGIGGLLVGAALLATRLRADRDEDDGDGAVL